MSYERVNEVLMQILERKYDIKIDTKVERRNGNERKTIKESISQGSN